jgi:trimeric autotransporter adhesin
MRIAFIFILLHSSISYAQNWAPVASFNKKITGTFYDEINNELYFCGWFNIVDGDTIYQITKWDGETFYPIGCGIIPDCSITPHPNSAQIINNVIVYNDTLYATGFFSSINGQLSNSLIRFNGSHWEPVGEGLFDNDGFLGVGHRLKIINDELYVCGQFSFCNGIPANSIAKYNGYSWSSVFDVPQIDSETSPIKDIEYYQGDWYLGGNFSEVGNNGGPIKDIIMYNGSEWTDVGGGVPGSLSLVEGFEIFEGKLMVYGVMSKSWGSPGNGIAAWNGEQWDDVGGGLENFVDNHILDAQVINGKLYATGSIKFAGGVFAPNIAVWDGENWCSLGTELNTFQGDIYSIVEFNNEIIVSGSFSLNETDTTIKHIAKWIGGDFVSACGNATSIEDKPDLDSFEIYPNPITNQLNIRNSSLKGTFQVSILDATGRLIQNEQFSGIGTHTLNLSGLAKGIYYCRIMQGNEMIVVEKVTKF